MARTPIGVRIELDHIHCHEEGDGIGSAEPYLWTVFFKVDGTTVSVTPGFTLDGEATVEFTPGSHGNLPNSDVDPGEDVDILGILGDWSTQLVATRTLTNQEVTDEEIAAFEESISEIVADAVSSQQNVFENIWSWLNED